MRIWKKRDHIFTRCVYSEIVDSFYLGQCCLLTDLYWFPAWNQFNTHKIITWHLLDFTWQGSIDVGKILTGKNSDICSAHSWQEFSPPANFTRNRWVLVYSDRKKNLIGLQKMHPMLVNYSILQFNDVNRLLTGQIVYFQRRQPSPWFSMKKRNLIFIQGFILLLVSIYMYLYRNNIILHLARDHWARSLIWY